MTSRHDSPSLRRQRISILLYLALAVFVITILARRRASWEGEESLANLDSATSFEEARKTTKSKRAYLSMETGYSEGLGSMLNRFKEGVVLAGGLDAEFILSEAGKWAYRSSGMWNGELEDVTGKPAPSTDIDASLACHLKNYILPHLRERLVRGLCAGEEWAAEEMGAIRKKLENCTSFVDTENTRVTQDLNGCVMHWVRKRLAPSPKVFRLPPPLAFPVQRPVTVGVHIRWGDTAANYTGKLYGSMALPNVVRILQDIKANLGQHGVQLLVLMQQADPQILAQLDERVTGIPYTLVDSSVYAQPVGDLYQLAHTDIILAGESSYAVLAHLIAPPGLTIVEGIRLKYTNTSGFGRHVVFLDEYTPESLELATKRGS